MLTVKKKGKMSDLTAWKLNKSLVVCIFVIFFLNFFPSFHNLSQCNAGAGNIAIIGGAGNVGSYLTLHLRQAGFHVDVFDKDHNGEPGTVLMKHSRSITSKDLQTYKTVIFLGGCTGRKACASLSPEERKQVNTIDVLDIVKKMHSTQHFITASTSAVSEGRFNAKEFEVIQDTTLDEYSLSMYEKELSLKEFANKGEQSSFPRVSMLRFGTVVGVSPAQRTDLLFPSLFKAAYTRGVLSVSDPHAMRSFLTLNDLARAIESLIVKIHQHQNLEGFQIWNIASFDASIIEVAEGVSSVTGALIDVKDDSSNSKGFTTNAESFARLFKFTFKGTLKSSVNDFNSNIPESILPKGPHADTGNAKDSIDCPVCGSKDLQVVLDLGSQPFANDFQLTPEKALASLRFPLKLMRCRVCNHYHLSHVASREDLFEQYLYQSGTSKTLKNHFKWLAHKVVEESGIETGNILELACNDGSQLNEFKALGWNTFGVDPAQNLVALARGKNHTVENGFWPLPFPKLPKGNNLAAITAQNVLAHVPSPVEFLKACAAIMGKETRLYIQTSQCNMQQLGQFDTVYHEHISFFTGHSFFKASELAGLQIESFETVPIHGTSCLVTMMLDKSNEKKGPLAQTLEKRIGEEKEDGIPTEFFGVKYATRANAIRDWLTSKILHLRDEGFLVGAYGAAAKGMTLLHFILDGNHEGSATMIDWVLDDGHLKQNRHCPGTVIPVLPTSDVVTMNNEMALAVVVLAWNFLDEILENLRSHLGGTRKDFIAVVPFPEPHLLKIQISSGNIEVLDKLVYNPSPIPNSNA